MKRGAVQSLAGNPPKRQRQDQNTLTSQDGATFTMADVPPEILQVILSHLGANAADLVRASEVSTTWNALVHNLCFQLTQKYFSYLIQRRTEGQRIWIKIFTEECQYFKSSFPAIPLSAILAALRGDHDSVEEYLENNKASEYIVDNGDTLHALLAIVGKPSPRVVKPVDQLHVKLRSIEEMGALGRHDLVEKTLADLAELPLLAPETTKKPETIEERKHEVNYFIALSWLHAVRRGHLATSKFMENVRFMDTLVDIPDNIFITGFVEACQRGNLDFVAPRWQTLRYFQLRGGLKNAALAGQTEVVKTILNHMRRTFVIYPDIRQAALSALVQAAVGGKRETLSYIMGFIRDDDRHNLESPEFKKTYYKAINEAMESAIKHRHDAVTKLLYPLVIFKQQALGFAVENGWTDMVHWMLSQSHGKIPMSLLGFLSHSQFDIFSVEKPAIGTGTVKDPIIKAIHRGYAETIAEIDLKQFSKDVQKLYIQACLMPAKPGILKQILKQLGLDLTSLRFRHECGGKIRDDLSALAYCASQENTVMLQMLLVEPEWRSGNLRQEALEVAKICGAEQSAKLIQANIDADPTLLSSLAGMGRSFLSYFSSTAQPPTLSAQPATNDEIDLDEPDGKSSGPFLH